MELIEYLRHIYRYWVWLLVAAVVGGLIGAGYGIKQKDAYQATVSLLVQRQSDSPTSLYFTYEGYYAQQTASAFTDNAIKLLTNDEIVKRAAQSANLGTDSTSLSNLKGAITAKKDAPQLIGLVVTMPTQQEATDFTKGLAESLKQRTMELNKDGDEKLTVDMVDLQPYVVLTRLPWVLTSLAGAVLGLLLGFGVSMVWDYTRRRG